MLFLVLLEVLFNNCIILGMVVKFRKEDVYFSFLCDFNNGSIVYNYELFFVDNKSLKIFFYYDDFEIIN